MKEIKLTAILDSIIDVEFQNVPHSYKSDFQRKMKTDPTYITCLNAMKIACNTVVEICAENAETIGQHGCVDYGSSCNEVKVDRDSILNVVNNIKI